MLGRVERVQLLDCRITDIYRSSPSTRFGSFTISSRSSAGSTHSGADWNAIGRKKRRIELAPTEVCNELVAGHGPPWCCAQATETPVG